MVYLSVMRSNRTYSTLGKCFVLILMLVVNTRAAELTQGKCSSGSVTCDNGDCIARYDVCDGPPNCSDGSDEFYPICMKNRCPAGSFRCAYGGCIDNAGKCNGIQDCRDNSDERLTSCPGFKWLTSPAPPCSRRTDFQCRNGECKSLSASCDGKVDCSDGSDESIEACYDVSCPLHAFRCAYGGCISGASRCDFKNDCADGSDEHYRLCNYPKNQTTSTSKPLGVQCTVPDYHRTYFSRIECIGEDCAIRNGNLVNDGEVLKLNCRSPYYPPDTNFVRCSKGEWTPKEHTCLSVCKPLISTSLNITCKYKDRPVNCSTEVPAGTVADLKCRDGYEKTEVLLRSYNECRKNGNWLYAATQHCYYRCGILHKNIQPVAVVPLIDYGEPSIAAHHPWNVGLYTINRPSNYIYLFCGGTLISPFTVLSAAHCFVNENTAERIDVNDIWISLGKTSSDWSLSEDTEQRIQVKHYSIPEKYAAHNLSFLYDVAVLELKTQAVVSIKNGLPMPACIANPNIQLKRGSVGLLAGWGENNGEYSGTLLAANLTYQPYEYCREHANNTILQDHFCAYNNEANNSMSQPTVNHGDSGSGFIKEINGNHYVYGVASTRYSTNLGFNLSTFTDVTHSTICNFVKTELRMICEKHSNYGFSDITCK